MAKRKGMSAEFLRNLRRKHGLGEFKRSGAKKKSINTGVHKHSNMARRKSRRSFFSRARRRVSHSRRSPGGFVNTAIRVGQGVAVGQGVMAGGNAALGMVGNLGGAQLGGIAKTALPLVASYAAYKSAGQGMPGIVAALPTLAQGGINIGSLLGGGATAGAGATTTGATFS